MNKVKYLKKALFLLVFFVAAFSLASCKTNEPKEKELPVLGKNQIYIYYVNADRNGLCEFPFNIDKDAPIEKQVSSVMSALYDNTPEGYISPIPDNITYTGCTAGQTAGRLDVSFDVVYDNLDADCMLFFKAAVTKCLIQLDTVNGLTMVFTDISASDPEAAVQTESFDQDSFLMSFGDSAGYKQKGAITLYFASADGEYLVPERCLVEITNNTSLARRVLESLIDGPISEDSQPTIPEGTVINSVNIKDGVCYVDLSDEFYSTDNPLKNDIIIYSIVDSLVELPTVSKVQFLRGGEKVPFYRETFPFDGLLERNLDIVQGSNTQAS